MHILYHDVYVLIDKIETINICQSFHMESAYSKSAGMLYEKIVFSLTSKTKTIFDLTENGGDGP